MPPDPTDLGCFDTVISLGRGCQPAYQIRRALKITEARVWDWVITPDPSLVTAIRSGLAHYFDRDTLILSADGSRLDRDSGVSFLHEFPKDHDFDLCHAKHAARVALLKQRWTALMASAARVLFVRQHGWSPDPAGQAEILRQTLRDAAPDLRFCLLYLVEPARFDPGWAAQDILFLPLTQAAPYDWRGDNAAWDRLLAAGLRLCPAPR